MPGEAIPVAHHPHHFQEDANICSIHFNLISFTEFRSDFPSWSRWSEIHGRIREAWERREDFRLFRVLFCFVSFPWNNACVLRLLWGFCFWTGLGCTAAHLTQPYGRWYSAMHWCTYGSLVPRSVLRLFILVTWELYCIVPCLYDGWFMQPRDLVLIVRSRIQKGRV